MSRFIPLLAAILITASPLAAQPVPEGKPLEFEGDLASELVERVDRFLKKEIAASVARRDRAWERPEGVSAEEFREAKRQRLAHILGMRDELVADPKLETRAFSILSRDLSYSIQAVRWPVLDGVTGEGLMLSPQSPGRRGTLVLVPDAGQSPEQQIGREVGLPPEQQLARRLVQQGFQVLVPTIIDRETELSRTMRGARKTGLTHREFLYRPAFELGRHLIGYEVQRVLAGVKALRSNSGGSSVSLVGVGEGGRIALAATALEPSIETVWIAGAFGPREEVWKEPLDRNVFGLLEDSGDAELAALIAPRPLVIEASRWPEFELAPGTRGGPGRLVTPPLERVRGEFERIAAKARALEAESAARLVVSGEGDGPPGSDGAMAAFLDGLGLEVVRESGQSPVVLSNDEPRKRHERQFREIERHTQAILAESPYVRDGFMRHLERTRDLEKYRASAGRYREIFRDEIIGHFDRELLPVDPSIRKIFEREAFTGYEVLLPVFDEIIATGILVLPSDLEDGERRPVVVCQHGLEGRPRDLAHPDHDHRAYNQYALRLAERGFITFSPQNLYLFGDRFRVLQRQANAIGKTLFSVIVPQHQQIVNWLKTRRWVDPERIAFYGLSYGGKTAMRVPALVTDYCLSICSADFNDWIWKNASTRSPYSYVSTGEYEIFEFDLGSTFNYSQMAALIAPRPFMVERGHRDGVAPDHRVASEYARVRRLYVDLGIADRTRIEFFDGPHTIHGVGTFEFLHEHLDWPMREPPRSLIRPSGQ